MVYTKKTNSAAFGEILAGLGAGADRPAAGRASVQRRENAPWHGCILDTIRADARVGRADGATRGGGGGAETDWRRRTVALEAGGFDSQLAERDARSVASGVRALSWRG